MQDYIEKTKKKEEDFEMLKKKDKVTSKVIEKQMRNLIAFHNEMAQLKRALIVKGYEKINYICILLLVVLGILE